VIAVGSSLPEFVDTPLTRTDFVRYQGASGDMNPLHHDDERAIAAGFPSVYAVGMLQAGVLGSWVADQFGPENVRRFAVRFREQAWPGDVITYSGTVTGLRTGSGGEQLLDLELRATRQTGADHLVGEATVVIPGD
jgi:acyl dehydratase